jgi:hypothetical protein
MSRGLTIREAHDLFREYVDDPDATFITTAQVQRYLEFGLDQWRQIIRGTNPHIYAGICEFSNTTPVDSSYTAQDPSVKPRRNTLDLGAPLLRSSMSNGNQASVMGSAAVADWFKVAPAVPVLQTPPIDSILDVYSYNSADKNRLTRYRQLAGAKAQDLSALFGTYFLEGTVLGFNGTPPDHMIVEYFPIARYRMDYALTSTYIEDNLLPQFHETVVLLATKRYMIRDQNTNQILLQELAAQIQGMTEYLTESQLLGARDHVTVTMQF